ncbi:DeoD-type purine-nucleoside phosphorylase [Deinococcus peraridilitoris]|uniref:Uridine phosphorylase n=1 Tax=Deinococcus peraridilitoris (strain DSM 19664 / LMG 22246 / CIP 109416 / KR-200) TaxID=937777 RepID=L0A4J7_DEIPD|nr:DeoD-type purine-nucleoside phosphorylase [Deinococcus peraridilitoris]AFZ68813.1 purine-nucleoside phosphorylase [Deinococcus peraridilitoris DSM 19664]
MSQIHVRAQPQDVAPFVLLPGDPGRARWIAETYLDDPALYTEHRGLLGFTGTYQGIRVSVQTTGMGCPSASIVAEELVRLGATHLLRVGTCGAATPTLKAAELVIAQAAVPNDGTTRQYLGGAPYAPTASYALVEASVKAARAHGLRHHVGLIMTEDAFYASSPEHARKWAGYGVLAFEMEASALFLVAAMRGVQAGCLVTVSNDIGDPQLVPDEVLARGVDEMVRTALDAFVLIARGER